MDNAVSINHTKDNTIEFELTADGLASKDMAVKFCIDAEGVDIGFIANKKAKSKDIWEVKLPPLSILTKDVYPFHISVHADGYHFEPMKGIVNVTGETKLFADKLENTTFAPRKKTATEKKEETVVKQAEKKEEKKESKAEENARKVGDIVKTVKKTTSKFSIQDKKDEPKKDEPKKPEPKKEEKVKETVQTKPVEFGDEVEQIAAALLSESNKVKEIKEPVAVGPMKEKDQRVLAVLEQVGITPRSKMKRPRISFIKSEIFPDKKD